MADQPLDSEPMRETLDEMLQRVVNRPLELQRNLVDKKLAELNGSINEGLGMLGARLDDMSEDLDRRLGAVASAESVQALHAQLAAAAERDQHLAAVVAALLARLEEIWTLLLITTRTAGSDEPVSGRHRLADRPTPPHQPGDTSTADTAPLPAVDSAEPGSVAVRSVNAADDGVGDGSALAVDDATGSDGTDPNPLRPTTPAAARRPTPRADPAASEPVATGLQGLLRRWLRWSLRLIWLGLLLTAVMFAIGIWIGGLP